MDLLEVGKLVASLPAPILLGGAAVLFYRNWQASEDKYELLLTNSLKEKQAIIDAWQKEKA